MRAVTGGCFLPATGKLDNETGFRWANITTDWPRSSVFFLPDGPHYCCYGRNGIHTFLTLTGFYRRDRTEDIPHVGKLGRAGPGEHKELMKFLVWQKEGMKGNEEKVLKGECRHGQS